jgi:hypothetical protein
LRGRAGGGPEARKEMGVRERPSIGTDVGGRGRWIALLALALLAALALPATAAASPRRLPALTPAPTDSLSRALARGRLTAAGYALARARQLFQPRLIAARFPGARRPDPHAATLILRDLAARAGQLPPRQRRQAHALLARLTDPSGDGLHPAYTVHQQQPLCDAHLCVHWVATTDDAPAPTDANHDGVNDWVALTKRVFDHVWQVEVGDMNYRKPLSDQASVNNEGDGRLDVYVADLGADGLYGYCTTDDPHADPGSGYRYFDVSAYCVVDDDFARSQFTSGAYGAAALEVTAAHEFFHAVQFAYDWLDDTWLMEGSAAWMEDQVYDSVNDNRQYLRTSALTAPRMPLDRNEPFWHYGAWIFWRFLSERLGRGRHDYPGILRQVWSRAAGGPHDRDEYSLQATRNALEEHGLRFAPLFATFAAWNRAPARSYSEGRAYPAARDRASVALGGRRLATRWGRTRLDHLTSTSYGYAPARGLPRGARLRVDVALPSRAAGGAAVLLVVGRQGGARVVPVRVSRRGRGSARVGFSRRAVRRVELVLANGSTRISGCYRQATPWSCSGVPRDQHRLFRFRARVER